MGSGRDRVVIGLKMAHPKVTAMALLLLLICSASLSRPTSSDPPQTPQPPQSSQLTQLGSAAVGLLGRGVKVAGGLLERLRPPTTPQSILDAYEKGTAAVMTYTGILTDQLYHWWQGDH